MSIFLIYQPRGCPESLFDTLRYLVEGGYAPLVVSNTPIAPADQERLQKLSWKCVERPNLGYDFGGYRDGIWLLGHLGVEPDTLLMLNDTLWFPLRDGDDGLERLETLEGDFLGLADGVYYGYRGFARPKGPGIPHVASYLLLLRGAALKSDEFRTYWDSYLVSSIKRNVVWRGEAGFSQAMAEAGFPSRCLYEKADLVSWAEGLDQSRQRELLDNLSIIPSRFEERRLALLSDSAERRNGDRLTELLCEIIHGVNTSDCLAFEGIATLNFPFLKKTILKNEEVRGRFLSDVASSTLAINPTILKEIRRLEY